MSARYAVYYTAPKTLLARIGAACLGHYLHLDQSFLLPESFLRSGFSPSLATSARIYGYHATLKAPFTLRDDQDEKSLVKAFETFCKNTVAGTLGPLKVKDHYGFVAVCPVTQSASLERLEREIVEGFEPFRAPLSATDRARRQPERLSARQVAHLDAYGYPYVLDDFHFHMTLTSKIEDLGLLETLLEAYQELFAPAFESHPAMIDSLTLVRQPNREARFELLSSASLPVSP